ncbi:10179_t:CDS:2, partial [Racocetra fulgida]
PLSKFFPPSTSSRFLEFISHLLRYDPRQRLTALDALKHPYFVESDFIFVPQHEPEDIKVIGMEKKRKNDTQIYDASESYTSVVNPTTVNCGSPMSIDLRRFQLPDDVMRFFGVTDELYS